MHKSLWNTGKVCNEHHRHRQCQLLRGGGAAGDKPLLPLSSPLPSQPPPPLALPSTPIPNSAPPPTRIAIAVIITSRMVILVPANAVRQTAAADPSRVAGSDDQGGAMEGPWRRRLAVALLPPPPHRPLVCSSGTMAGPSSALNQKRTMATETRVRGEQQRGRWRRQGLWQQ